MFFPKIYVLQLSHVNYECEVGQEHVEKKFVRVISNVLMVSNLKKVGNKLWNKVKLSMNI